MIVKGTQLSTSVGDFQRGRKTWYRTTRAEEGQPPQQDFGYLELLKCMLFSCLSSLQAWEQHAEGQAGLALCLMWNSSISCLEGCKITLRCYILILAVTSVGWKNPFILIYWFFRMQMDSGQKGSPTSPAGFSEGLFNFVYFSMWNKTVHLI